MILGIVMTKFLVFMQKKWVRIAVGILIPVAGILGATFLFHMQGHIPCIFQKLTGLHCPGCGAARASRALLHFDVLLALDRNVLFVLFAPFGVYFILKQYIRYVFGKDVLPMFRISYPVGVAILVSVVLFWILRNIPVFPFTILAP